jgi:hypothetical protein
LRILVDPDHRTSETAAYGRSCRATLSLNQAGAVILDLDVDEPAETGVAVVQKVLGLKGVSLQR